MRVTEDTRAGVLASAQHLSEHTCGFESSIAYEWAGLTCVEIAALTGEQPTAIRMRVCRARARFCDDYEREVAYDV